MTRQPRNWVRWSAVVLAAAGWWLSYDLLRIGYGANPTNAWLAAQCSGEAPAGGAFDCRSVLQTSWAYVPLGPQPGSARLQVAAVGLGYFSVVGLWYLLVGPPTRSRWGWHVPILLLVAAGTFESIQFLGVMSGVLQRWCAGCVAVHAVNFGLALLTLLALPWRRDALDTAPHPRPRLALAGFAACCLAFVGQQAVVLMLNWNHAYVTMREAYNKVTTDADFIRWDYARQPALDVALATDEEFEGSPDAPHTVIAFIDFQCQVCEKAHDMIERMLEQHPGRLRVQYRHYPLDRSCNAKVSLSPHPAACRAAWAAQAAGAAGGPAKLREMRRALYQHQEKLDTEIIPTLVSRLGIDPTAFRARFEAEATRQRVQRDIELAAKLGVTGTPTIFLDGKRLTYWNSESAWAALLE